MKKIQQTIAVCALAACFITGCSNAPESEPAPSVTEEVTATPQPTIDTEIHADNLMGIYIGKDKNQIGLGLTTGDTKDILGKADDIKKSGKKTTWYYKDLDVTITFQKKKDARTITSIRGGKNADTLLTGGGIAADSTREEVLTAYREQLGSTDTGKDSIIIKNLDYSRLVITLKKDVVVSVSLELV